VISAGKAAEPKAFIGRLLASSARSRRVLALMESMHRAQAKKNGRWMSLPHSHGDLVFTQAGAKDTAAATLEFIRSLR
jgi:hypothetical protein